jgi:hypothetical protein
MPRREGFLDGGRECVNLGPTDKRTPPFEQMYRHSESLGTRGESPACNSLSVTHGPIGASTARLRGF